MNSSDAPTVDNTRQLRTALEHEWDLHDLVVPQNYADRAQVTAKPTQILIRKPHRQEWFWMHPDPSVHRSVRLIEDSETRESFLVASSFENELIGEWRLSLLVICQTRTGSVFLCPLTLPNDKGTGSTWAQSALFVFDKYRGKLIRRVANHDAKAYDVYTTKLDVAEPDWPEDLDSIYKLAFKDRVIMSSDHPVVKRLRGEA